MGKIPSTGFTGLTGLEPGVYTVSVGNDDTITVSRNAPQHSRRLPARVIETLSKHNACYDTRNGRIVFADPRAVWKLRRHWVYIVPDLSEPVYDERGEFWGRYINGRYIEV